MRYAKVVVSLKFRTTWPNWTIRRLMHVRLAYHCSLHTLIPYSQRIRWFDARACVRACVCVFVFFLGPNIAHKIYWQNHSFPFFIFFCFVLGISAMCVLVWCVLLVPVGVAEHCGHLRHLSPFCAHIVPANVLTDAVPFARITCDCNNSEAIKSHSSVLF